MHCTCAHQLLREVAAQHACSGLGSCVQCSIKNHINNAFRSSAGAFEPEHIVNTVLPQVASDLIDREQQHDAHEFLRLLINGMGEGYLSTLFQGWVQSSVKCEECGHVSSKEEFIGGDLGLEVTDDSIRTVKESLVRHTKVETLCGENAYQ